MLGTPWLSFNFDSFFDVEKLADEAVAWDLDTHIMGKYANVPDSSFLWS